MPSVSAGIVDSREPMNDRLLLVQKHGWVESALPAGDYQWALPKPEGEEDNIVVGVEAGTIEDIVSNLDRKREEVIRLSQSVDVPILLCLGAFERAADGTVQGVVSRIPYSTVRKFLMTIQLHGVLIAHGPHNMRVAAVLDTQKWTEKEIHTSMLPLEKKYKTDPRLLALSMIPGIRASTALSLQNEAERAGSPLYLPGYSQEAYETFEGIGKKRAKALYEFWELEGAAK